MRHLTMQYLLAAMSVIAASLIADGASAHSSSSSYLTVSAKEERLDIQWELALRDLDDAVGLDEVGNGVLTWGAVKERRSAIIDYVASRLSFTGDGSPCPIGSWELLVDHHGDGTYAVVRAVAHCPETPRAIGIRYDALFDIDQQHRGLLNFVSGALSRTEVFSPGHRTAEIDAKIAPWRTFFEFFRSGIDHILGGWDHALFVTMLLLPAMFTRQGGRHWEAVTSFRPAFFRTVAILTSFTLAHALSLGSVVLGLVSIPARMIEGAIALTIVVTAIDNVTPILRGRRAVVAFGFGLIHGLGFAGSLGPLSLPPAGMALALAAFNAGVEAAQLAAASVVLPLGFAVRRGTVYRQVGIPLLSGLSACVAALWFVGRILDIRIIPF